ncbi:MAG: efflux RND transporter permease subunit [Deltaproteobacteria bacterium]|nr:efflux RND transporter permease subunit [Deltaproteobacteria bacterium]
MSLAACVHAHRTAIVAITALGVAAGAVAAWTLPVSIFPEVAFHRVSLIARATNLPVEQTLTAVTQPLENAMTGVLDVETIRSTTTRGGAQLDLVFGWQADMPLALQRVQAAMEETRAVLPAGTELEARLLDTSAFPIVGVAISAADGDLARLSDFALYEAAPRLRTVPSVYRVDLNGAKVREYALTVDPVALAQHGLDLATVENAVRSANLVAAAGSVVDGPNLALTVVRGPGAEASALGQVVVAQQGGVPVTLDAVARVDSALREDFTRAAADGQGAVLLGISRRPDGNAVRISAEVRQRLAELARQHPDLHFSIFYDQAELVRDAIASVRDSIAIGLVLAVATVFAFIGDRRATAVAAAVVPATVLITCTALSGLGMSFNLMTLGGIAAGIGLILDDAIVVVENVHRHRLAGLGGEAAVRAALAEITRPLLGSTLTPVAVLLPLGQLGGVPGAFFQPLAITMSIALLVSLGLALTFTPALAAVAESGTRTPRHGAGDRVVEALAAHYAHLLDWALRHRVAALAAALAMIVVGGLAYERVETGFIPTMDEGAFVLDYWAPTGSSLNETERLLAQVDALLRATPEVASFSRRTGAELGFFLTETNRGDYAVRLRRDRRRGSEAVVSQLRESLHDRVPALRVEFVQILQDMIGDLSGNPSPVEVKLFSERPAALRTAAVAAAQRIAAVPGAADVFAGLTEIGPTYEVAVDARRAARAGIDTTAVQHALEIAVSGVVVGQVVEDDRAIPLRLRGPDAFRRRLAALDDLVLATPAGGLAPLAGLATLAAGPPSLQLERENLRSLARVTATLEGRSLGAVTDDVQQAMRGVPLPPDVRVEYGGLHASQQEAFQQLLVVFGTALACVAALLLIEFGSLAATAAVIGGSLLALSGSLLALWLTNTALNVSSIVGMVMVIGIVAKNGILLLDFAAQVDVGETIEARLIAAGRVRLRPILMTSLATAAGLAPLAVGLGAGGEMQQPLAIAILGGLSVAMACSLLGVPVLYAWLAHPAAEISYAPAAG